VKLISKTQENEEGKRKNAKKGNLEFTPDAVAGY
jgi:hypothetical protein